MNEMWIKNTDGKKDAVLTLALAGFVVVLLKVLLGGFHLEVAGKDITLGTIDASVIGAILTPTLGAYVARRYTDKKYHKPDKPGPHEKKA
jgi:hypothetical protein